MVFRSHTHVTQNLTAVVPAVKTVGLVRMRDQKKNKKSGITGLQTVIQPDVSTLSTSKQKVTSFLLKQ